MTMTTYTGKQNVEPGLYLNLKKFSIKHVEAAGALPGAETDTYYRLPMLVVLATAPLLGLAFVIFLPFIGFAMVAWLLGDKALQWTGNAVTEAVRVVRPNWAPSLAFLSRSKPAKKAQDEASTPDAWKDGVEKKLNGKNDESHDKV
jgi:hypothetical protein